MSRIAASLAVLLAGCCLAAALCGCGQEEKASPFLESERRIEGMYEECMTIEIDDPTGELPEVDTEEIKSLPKVDVDTVLVRSNGMAKQGVWSGVRLGDVLRHQGVEEPFVEIRLEAWDGYVAKIPYEMAMRPDTILAWEEDGAPIPEEQGPVRSACGSRDGYLTGFTASPG